MKVYKNARGNDLRNAQKSIDCCHHFCRLWVYIETKYFHFIPVVVHITLRARPLALSVVGEIKCKINYYTKVDGIASDRPFL